ncbi:hypothetical protein FJT64_012492 [Amphibalanus amphitrite]|uniref:Uncharacterized protein n=1 Tax=Amphibalanus amphitrite TaxID=1232801 RepID=A0A6A4V687_AMPAM|nr:hypothetical protein FJT64_012492 [Amphibalanus amphitrite]
MFMDATKNLSVEARTWIIVMATAVKNKERILQELSTKFLNAPWRETVYQFYLNKTVTKNSDNIGPTKLLPVLEDQRAYEEDLWNNKITKGGRNYEKGFQLKYWETRSKDRYPLLNWDMTKYLPNQEEPYTKAQIVDWLKLTGEVPAGRA